MTWGENMQWSPGWGEKKKKWLKLGKELVEYFDFVQKVMGGAIAEIFNGCDEMFETVVNTGAALKA